MLTLSKTIEGEGLINCMSPSQEPCADFQLGLENQPIAPGILTESSRYKRSESSLLADEKLLQQAVVWLYIYLLIEL